MRRLWLLGLAFLSLPSAALPQVVSRQVGNITVIADLGLAFPGGLFVAHLHSHKPLNASAYAIFDGRRCPFFPDAHGLRALVPIAPTLAHGSYTLGVEIRSARRRRRIPLQVAVARRDYPPREVFLPEAKRSLVQLPAIVRESRHLLLQLRTVTPIQRWRPPFRPPVESPPLYSYGAPTRYIGASPVEERTDGVYGEYHRGMDYAVPAGTVVQAPAAGAVLMAEWQTATGNTVVLDHGEGVLSVFFHLGKLDVRPGEELEARAPLGLSGETGLAASPHVHWAVYVHGVAVDPRVMERLSE
jgi:murein DD-endopeptidase MepM/ murein hydrolase activator NlpD